MTFEIKPVHREKTTFDAIVVGVLIVGVLFLVWWLSLEKTKHWVV